MKHRKRDTNDHGPGGGRHYPLMRFHLSLSTFAGIVPMASHWWCRVRWKDASGKHREEDAERGRMWDRTGRFDTCDAARAAGLRLVAKIARREGIEWRVVTEGEPHVVDPQRVVSAPGNIKVRANALWRAFESHDGWSAPRDKWPALTVICEEWSRIMGES